MLAGGGDVQEHGDPGCALRGEEARGGALRGEEARAEGGGRRSRACACAHTERHMRAHVRVRVHLPPDAWRIRVVR